MLISLTVYEKNLQTIILLTLITLLLTFNWTTKQHIKKYLKKMIGVKS